MRWFMICTVSTLLITWTVNNVQGEYTDKIESIEGKNAFNPNIISARMYDYSTNTIAYKDKSAKKCYIQRMQKLRPVPLYISDSQNDSQEVELLAGHGVVRFCQGMDVYKLLVQIRK